MEVLIAQVHNAVCLYTGHLFTSVLSKYVRNGSRFGPMPPESFHHADYIMELVK